MDPSQRGGDDRSTSRRSVLAHLGGTAAAVAGTAGCLGDSSGGGGEQETTGGGTVTFGLTTSESGPFNMEGAEEQRGFELAVDHLNDGGGWVGTDTFPDLSGDGVLGKEVEGTVKDTGGSAGNVEEISKSFARNDDIVMYTGGIASNVVLSLRDAADEHGIPYMAGPTPVDSLSGSSCSAYVFRELFSATSMMRALGPALVDNLGTGLTYYNITVDTPAGSDLRDAVDSYFSETGSWRLSGNETTTLGSTSFEDQLQTAIGSVPEVLVLNLFGLDAANALKQANDTISDDIHVVVPYMDHTVAETVDADIATVYGTIPWTSGIDNGPSNAFEDAYSNRYGSSENDGGGGTPTGIAHHAYVQTLQYAAAAERTGSFDADALTAELEDHSYDVGTGSATLRACDHQSKRSVPVVQGRRSSHQRNGQYLDLLALADDVTPACDEPPASNCSF